jgi:hypothetical protein
MHPQEFWIGQSKPSLTRSGNMDGFEPTSLPILKVPAFPSALAFG